MKTLQDMHNLAQGRGFLFLSTQYKGVMTKHSWRCNLGHEWIARPNDIQSGCGCPHCAGVAKKSLFEITQDISDRPIILLSRQYLTMHTKYQWQCAKCNYIWKATASSIVNQGSGCPKCAGRCYSMKDILSLAKSRGFELLSKKFTGMSGRYKWKCPDQHDWETTAQHVKQGTGCPYCNNKYVQEEKCRFIFEQLTSKKFKKDRTTLGKRLELDGYCEELNLAFEYHGKQHYKKIPYWHKKADSLDKQQKRDNKKCQLCKDQRIDLIVIKWDCKNLEVFIRNELQTRNLVINDAINWENFRDTPCRLQEVQDAASKIGIKCLSKKYTTAIEPMHFQCNGCGREWESTANDIKNGYGCLRCGGRMKKTIQDMHELANKNNIKFLSKEYENARTKHKWKCSVCQSIFLKKPDDVRQGKCCPECGKKRRWETRREIK